MIAWNTYEVGKHRIRCPECDRGPRDRTLGLTIKADGRGVAHCYRCEFVETYRPDEDEPIENPSTPRIKGAASTEKRVTLSSYGRDLWKSCRPLSGVALAYLNARRCRIPPSDSDLRWHPSLKHRPSGYVGPALVARVTEAATGEPMSLHRTWICADGRKADVDPPRLLLGGHRKQGGVIRLWPDEAMTTGLGIAEGIETALSLAWAYAPAWSCIDAGNLADFPVLPGVEALTIAADRDKAGQDAADECAQRWVDAGHEVFVTCQLENDLNDLLQMEAA
jgi:putative DNA primase/helicase